MNFYNEHDPKAAAWLRELISAGHIPPGVVDERDIQLIAPNELSSYTQCHFFAGVGGWSLALQLAGWPATRPVWTGSCPCQPFSTAGKGKGVEDERHLWPVFRELIRQCRPPTVFGEQVASKAGREWLAGVFLDLEGMAYRRAGADLCAAGVGAPHIRQRLWWVADSGRRCVQCERNAGKLADTTPNALPEPDERERCRDASGHSRTTRRLADSDCGQCSGLADGQGCERNRQTPGRDQGDSESQCGCSACRMAVSPSERRDRSAAASEPAGRSVAETSGGLVHTFGEGLEGHAGHVAGSHESGWLFAEENRPTSAPSRPWDQSQLLPCTDGKARRVEPGTFPLADGFPGRVGLLRGYGNAIVPQVAAEFIQAFEEASGSM